MLFSPTTSKPWNYFNCFIPLWVTRSCLCRQCPASTLQCFWSAGTLWPSQCLLKMWQQGKITYTVLFPQACQKNSYSNQATFEPGRKLGVTFWWCQLCGYIGTYENATRNSTWKYVWTKWTLFRIKAHNV